jgi:3-oxoacyl-[acyl-carrier protein] reductase
MKKLENKIILLTGGSRGIGEATAYALADEGAHLGINYVRSQKQAERICENIREKNRTKAIALKADVSAPGEVQEMVTAMLGEFGRIDVLVNNAGMLVQGSLVHTSLEDWNRMIAIDLTGVFLCTKAVLPSMLERKEGRIINVASQLGHIGAPELVAYSAAKGGVIAFTKALAREVAQDGILVNCVAPGPIETDMLAGLTEEWTRRKLSSLPLGRFGLPEEVASSVVFLASSDSAIFVGQTLGPNSGDVML